MNSGGNSSPENSEENQMSESSSPEIQYEMEALQLHQNALLLQTQMNLVALQTHLSNRQNASVWGGSVPNRQYVYRGRVAGHHLFKQDYFSANPTYGEDFFRRRYRMSRNLFMHVRRSLKNHSDFWRRKTDSAHTKGFSSYQKMGAAIQMLAYGCAADSCDQYFRMAESTTLQCLKMFCSQIVEIHSNQYLRQPNEDDMARLLHVAELRGFPGMLGSIDCMHWQWKNTPTEVAGQYRGRNKGCTIVLEAVASYDLWIWHAFFGLPGSNNDINVINNSHVFHNLARGNTVPCNYVVDGRNFDVGYYLADGIYPSWKTLVKAIRRPRGEQERYFVRMQESYRKDVERAFGVLQARWGMVRGAARLWNKDDLHNVINACIILHNMIVEEERHSYHNMYDYHEHEPPTGIDYIHEGVPQIEDIERNMNNPAYVSYLRRYGEIFNKAEHKELQRRLVQHLWSQRGER